MIIKVIDYFIYKAQLQYKGEYKIPLIPIFISPSRKAIRRYLKKNSKVGRTNLCDICAALTTKFCKCKLKWYCRKKCQKIGWKRNHKIICTVRK